MASAWLYPNEISPRGGAKAAPKSICAIVRTDLAKWQALADSARAAMRVMVRESLVSPATAQYLGRHLYTHNSVTQGLIKALKVVPGLTRTDDSPALWSLDDRGRQWVLDRMAEEARA